MNRHTRVSFITPTYNDEPNYLAEAVQSVAGQTYPDVEHIIVDDGSTDTRAVDYVKRLGVRVIRQRNQGPAAARNTAVRASSGDVLVLLDADDKVSSEYAMNAVHTLEDPNVTIAYPEMREFGAGKNVYRTTGDRSVENFFSSSGVPIGSALRRQDYLDIGGFDETITHGFEDQEFWIRLMLMRPGVAHEMSGATFYYRVRSGSRSTVVSTAEGSSQTRERAVRNALDHGYLEKLALHLWDGLDQQVQMRRAVVRDPLYLRPHAARLKVLLSSARYRFNR